MLLGCSGFRCRSHADAPPAFLPRRLKYMTLNSGHFPFNCGLPRAQHDGLDGTITHITAASQLWHYPHCHWNARQSAAFVSDPVTPPFDAGIGHCALSHRSLSLHGRSAMRPISFMTGLALLLHLITAAELTPMRSASLDASMLVFGGACCPAVPIQEH